MTIITKPKAYIISDPGAESGAIETIPPTDGLNILTIDELRQSSIRFTENDKVCITSEAVIEGVLERLDDETLIFGIHTMKDKVAFREALTSIFPSFWFKKVSIDQLVCLNFDHDKSYVVKPAKGCFGSGVRAIKGDADLEQLRLEITTELAKNTEVFSDSVLSSEEMIIEECIEGEEYAVDMFYNDQGKPVITNIYYHPMPNNPAYLHMIYCTNADIFSQIYSKAVAFFERFQRVVPVSNIPIHAEFRLQEDKLVPIEMNSMRFGGMGLTNLSHYALGVNAYQHFIADTEPDWDKIWSKRQDTSYAFFIAYNGENTDLQTHRPDWESFRAIFSDILHEVKFDYKKQLAFGILYIKGSEDHILGLVDTEFDDYFTIN